MSAILSHIIGLYFLLHSPMAGVVWQEEKIYTVSDVKIKPVPFIGLDHFQKKWSNKVTYPHDAVKNSVQGMVFIEFIVEKDGAITEAGVRSGLGFGCDEAALQGFKEMAKDAWRPGIKDDHPVRVKMVLPFQFRIVKL